MDSPIIRVLSHQIGEGRLLSIFETIAVIESKGREHGVRGNPLSVPEIVEDLVADTITNPMLERDRKTAIIENLQGLHPMSVLHGLLSRYQVSPQQLAGCLAKHNTLSPADAALAEQAEAATITERRRSALAGLFGMVAALTTVIAGTLALLATRKLEPLSSTVTPLFGVLVGAVASALALVVTMLYARERERIRTKEKEDKTKKDLPA